MQIVVVVYMRLPLASSLLVTRLWTARCFTAQVTQWSAAMQ